MKLELTRIPGSLEVRADEMSVSEIPLLCLDGYLHMVRLLLKQHEPDCNCEEMEFHKRIVSSMMKAVKEMDNGEKILHEMFKDLERMNNG